MKIGSHFCCLANVFAQVRQNCARQGEKESAPNVDARNRLTKIIIKSLTI